jgi:hypothetical protein
MKRLVPPPIPSVSDHAVLRYIERAHGVDIDGIRQHISDLVKRGVAAGGDAVVVEGVKFVLRSNVVVTVLEKEWRLLKPERDDA